MFFLSKQFDSETTCHYFTLSLQAPIYVHCASLHNSKPYKLRTPAVSRAIKYRYAKNQFYVDSEEMFTVSVWARNNKGLTSPATSLNITSLQLGKPNYWMQILNSWLL